MSTVRILVLGVTGMLGHSLFARLAELTKGEVYGASRSIENHKSAFNPQLWPRLKGNIDALEPDSIAALIAQIKPGVVINCIGLIKQSPTCGNPVAAISVNALFPHQLAEICGSAGARLIHISTDCVFDGKAGGYRETDLPNATDLYGRTKALGEVVAYPHCVTIRTSIIGHELASSFGLVEWFLAQAGRIQGFTNAFFSGLPTVEMARVISEYVIPHESLHGLYHVSAQKISKYELLKMTAEKYGKQIIIEPNSSPVIDRSLESGLFSRETGYVAPAWPDLVDRMYRDYISKAAHMRYYWRKDYSNDDKG